MAIFADYNNFSNRKVTLYVRKETKQLYFS